MTTENGAEKASNKETHGECIKFVKASLERGDPVIIYGSLTYAGDFVGVVLVTPDLPLESQLAALAYCRSQFLNAIDSSVKELIESKTS